MNELIAVNENNQTVSARDLHDALEVKYDFKRWVETNFEGFIEGEDYNYHMDVKVQTEGNRIVKREIADYDLSFDMAKHICLMSRTEKGKQCRQYLIDLEKAWNTPEQVMARALRIADETIKSLTVDVERMRPKAEYFDELVDRNLLTSFRDTAKELGIKERDFIAFLIDRKYIYRDKKNKLKPFADKNRGLFEVKEYNAKFSEHAGLQTLITPKGRETFRLLLKTGI